MRIILLIALSFLIISCSTNNNKNITILTNVNIYTDEYNTISKQSIAIENGIIIEINSLENLSENYKTNNIIDLNSNYIFPGFNDAHCHFTGYATNLAQYCDLKDTKSFDEIIDRLIAYDKKYSPDFLCGRGWDQNDWEQKKMPNWDKLNKAFPNKPVYLVRIDGHAAICNKNTFEIAEIDVTTKVNGGEILQESSNLTGVLLDKAMDLVRQYIPTPSQQQYIDALIMAQDSCIKYGLTSLTEAGLDTDKIQLIDSLQKAGILKLRMNIMLAPSQENFDFFENKYQQTAKLNISSVKLFADGALGSRGACLLHEYTDDDNNKGFITEEINYYKEVCQYAYNHNLQVCTHCIGDSANRLMLNIYSEFLKGKNDRRWRIEHAQIVNPKDIDKFGKFSIIPSIQSTHATSDMYWAEERIGTERINDAYQTKRLLEQNGWLPNGTDFPIERISPLETFYAAIFRQDKELFPENAFLNSQKLTRKEALLSITYWPAKASFEETKKGKIEVGMYADFVILDSDILTCSQKEIINAKIISVWIDGEKMP